MNRDKYNKMIQTVQGIELAKGFDILKLRTSYDDNGRLVEASWTSPEGTVFRQINPFTDHTEYWVDVQNYNSIVYRDFWS